MSDYTSFVLTSFVILSAIWIAMILVKISRIVEILEGKQRCGKCLNCHDAEKHMPCERGREGA